MCSAQRKFFLLPTQSHALRSDDYHKQVIKAHHTDHQASSVLGTRPLPVNVKNPVSRGSCHSVAWRNVVIAIRSYNKMLWEAFATLMPKKSRPGRTLCEQDLPKDYVMTLAYFVIAVTLSMVYSYPIVCH